MTKKSILSLFSICLLITGLTACGKTGYDLGEKYVEGQDDQYYLRDNEAGFQNIAFQKIGYYFTNSGRIYYMDKNSLKVVPLCNKPNCDHNDNKCNAKIHCKENYNFLTCYKGKIYASGKNVINDKGQAYDCLYEISEDGGNRKEVMKLTDRPLAIHRGYLYCVGTIPNTKLSYSLIRYDLKDIKTPEVVYEGSLEEGNIQIKRFYGNHLYFAESGVKDDEYVDKYIHYDLNTKKSKRIFSEEKYSYPSFKGIVNNRIYFTVNIEEVQENINISKSQMLYTCDLYGNDVKETATEIYYPSTLFPDDKYVYERKINLFAKTPEELSDRTITVYDKSFNKVDVISLDFLPKVYDSYCGDEKYMFFKFTDKDKKFHFKAIDKDTIGTGIVKIVDLFENAYEKQSFSDFEVVN